MKLVTITYLENVRRDSMDTATTTGNLVLSTSISTDAIKEGI